MIGVILWSDTQERKAVVWCEDQGDLAFLGGGDTRFDHLGQLEAGDILEFDVEVDGNFRRVGNPTLVSGYETRDVATSLINVTSVTETSMGNILAFPSPKPANAPAELPLDIENLPQFGSVAT